MADKMRVYEDALDMVEEEIEKISKKEELDDKCLEYLDKLIDISKDIETIMAMRNEYGSSEGYSQARRPYYSYDDGMNRYTDGHSYRNNRYSRNGDMRMKLEQMMNEAATEREREAIRRAIEQM